MEKMEASSYLLLSERMPKSLTANLQRHTMHTPLWKSSKCLEVMAPHKKPSSCHSCHKQIQIQPPSQGLSSSSLPHLHISTLATSTWNSILAKGEPNLRCRLRYGEKVKIILDLVAMKQCKLPNLPYNSTTTCIKP